jgi:hypothetical protein
MALKLLILFIQWYRKTFIREFSSEFITVILWIMDIILLSFLPNCIINNSILRFQIIINYYFQYIFVIILLFIIY